MFLKKPTTYLTIYYKKRDSYLKKRSLYQQGKLQKKGFLLIYAFNFKNSKNPNLNKYLFIKENIMLSVLGESPCMYHIVGTVKGEGYFFNYYHRTVIETNKRE